MKFIAVQFSSRRWQQLQQLAKSGLHNASTLTLLGPQPPCPHARCRGRVPLQGQASENCCQRSAKASAAQSKAAQQQRGSSTESRLNPELRKNLRRWAAQRKHAVNARVPIRAAGWHALSGQASENCFQCGIKASAAHR